MKRVGGMTIVEVMTVIAIIGVLVTIVIYVANSAQARSRDAKRKSDLTMIALGLQARYDSKTCAEAGYYPDSSPSAVGGWRDASGLKGTLVGDVTCGQSLKSIPAEPNSTSNNTGYGYSLSVREGGVVLARKHYRLGARLEKTLSGQEQAQLDTMIASWTANFGGAALPTDPVSGQQLYNYLIGN